MRTIKRLTYLILGVSILFASCSKNLDQPFQSQDQLSSRSATSLKPLLTGPYSNGFLLINEGWYSHGTGEVNFYNYATGTLQDSIFGVANPTKNLNPATSTLQFGTIFNGNLYLVSNVNQRNVTTCSPASLRRRWSFLYRSITFHGLPPQAGQVVFGQNSVLLP